MCSWVLKIHFGRDLNPWGRRSLAWWGAWQLRPQVSIIIIIIIIIIVIIIIIIIISSSSSSSSSNF